MPEMLQSTLLAIYEEMNRHDFYDNLAPQNRVDDLIEQLAEMDLGGLALVEEIMKWTPEWVAWEHIARLFGILSYTSLDNCAKVSRVSEIWLREATDERCCFVALNNSGVPLSGPNADPNVFDATYSIVEQRFPSLRLTCERLRRYRPKDQQP